MPTNKDYYIYGLLAGDAGLYKKKEGQNHHIFFSNVNAELVDIVKEWCIEKSYRHASFNRIVNQENWSPLYIVEIYTESVTVDLRKLGILNEDNQFNVIDNPDFLRGFFETAGTIFPFMDKKVLRYRIAFSGYLHQMEQLKEILGNRNIVTPSIIQRKERADQGIISESYRLVINRREGKVALLQNLYYPDCFGSLLYKDKVNEYWGYMWRTPLNYTGVYKHFSNASKAMCRHLMLSVKGEKNGNSGSGAKPITIKNKHTGEILNVCYGWEGTYNYLCKLWEQKTGLEVPKIIEG